MGRAGQGRILILGVRTLANEIRRGSPFLGKAATEMPVSFYNSPTRTQAGQDRSGRPGRPGRPGFRSLAHRLSSWSQGRLLVPAWVAPGPELWAVEMGMACEG